MTFSQRKGLKRVRDALQVDSMDDALRNSLWNAMIDFYWRGIDHSDRADAMLASIFPRNASDYPIVKRLWSEHLKRRIDEMDKPWSTAYEMIAKYFFTCEWNAVYDLVEFVADIDADEDAAHPRSFMDTCNLILEGESSGYRFIGGVITQVTSEEEVKEIEEASSLPFAPVTRHIKTALALMSNRKSPDYRNSVKESISAVEAACRLITKDNATLGQALKKVKEKVPLHPALENSFSALYGYTSNAGGIRHSLIDEKSDLDFADSKFMLVSCSAFVNYLFQKVSKAGMKLG